MVNPRNIIDFNTHRQAAGTKQRIQLPQLVISAQLRAQHFLKDMLMAPKLLLKGKLPLLPSTAGRKGMVELFASVREAEAEERRRIAALQPRVPGSGSGHPEPC